GTHRDWGLLSRAKRPEVLRCDRSFPPAAPRQRPVVTRDCTQERAQSTAGTSVWMAGGSLAEDRLGKSPTPRWSVSVRASVDRGAERGSHPHLSPSQWRPPLRYRPI